jgi:hypothetical protein
MRASQLSNNTEWFFGICTGDGVAVGRPESNRSQLRRQSVGQPDQCGGMANDVTCVGWSGFFIKMNVGDLAVPCFGIDALRDGSILRKTVDGLFQNGERRRTLPVMC